MTKRVAAPRREPREIWVVEWRQGNLCHFLAAFDSLTNAKWYALCDPKRHIVKYIPATSKGGR